MPKFCFYTGLYFWKKCFGVFFLILLPFLVLAQEKETSNRLKKTRDSIELAKKKRSPRVAALKGAVLPGWGQFYNKKYWKLPLVYGGAAGVGYAIYWNNAQYQYFRNVYQEAILSGDPEQLAERAATLRNSFRRSKEQMIIAGMLFYGLTVVDAIVDAQFSTFDIGDDLSLKIYPSIDFSPQGQAFINATLRIGFKPTKNN